MKVKSSNSIEQLTKLILEQITEEKLIYCEDKDNNVEIGDFIFITTIDNMNKIYKIECKSSYTYRKEKRDKLALDLFYFEKGSNFTKPYVQSTDYDYRGWIFKEADILTCFNYESNNFYIIWGYRELKNRIIELALDFIQNFDGKIKDMENGTVINDYLRFCKNYNDNCKDTLYISLDLMKLCENWNNENMQVFEIEFNRELSFIDIINETYIYDNFDYNIKLAKDKDDFDY